MALTVLASPIEGAALTAGDVDDNLNFAYYVDWANRTSEELGQYFEGLNLSDRVTLRIVDAHGAPVPGAKVSVGLDGADSPFITGYAGSDGVFRLFPRHDGAGNATSLWVRASDSSNESASSEAEMNLAAIGEARTLTVAVPGASTALPASLDLMIVMDTTGSMDDELEYLKDELGSIIGTVRDDHQGVDMRFGLIVYRDIGDVYMVRAFPFTTSLEDFQADLAAQVAYDGGDYPEAMDAALKAAMNASWRGAGSARIALLVADAPPHRENFARAVDQFDAARAAGIRIHALAGSGAGTDAEFAMRAGAVLTQGRYMFLTDDSGVGRAHGLPHIQCYEVAALSGLVARVVGSELAGKRVEAEKGSVIRTVGNISGGVCLDAEPQEPGAPGQPRLALDIGGGTTTGSSEPAGATPTSSSAGEGGWDVALSPAGPSFVGSGTGAGTGAGWTGASVLADGDAGPLVRLHVSVVASTNASFAIPLLVYPASPELAASEEPPAAPPPATSPRAVTPPFDPAPSALPTPNVAGAGGAPLVATLSVAIALLGAALVSTYRVGLLLPPGAVRETMLRALPQVPRVPGPPRPPRSFLRRR